MVNQKHFIKRARRMEMKHFAIQDWVEKDRIYLLRITSIDNYDDTLTKGIGRTLHYKHYGFIMGYIRPTYVDVDEDQITSNRSTDDLYTHNAGGCQ